MSAGPPAEYGTMIFTGFVGYAAWASATLAWPSASAATAIRADSLRKRIFTSSYNRLRATLLASRRVFGLVPGL